MTRSLYLSKWTFITGLTKDEETFLRDRFPESESDKTLYIETDRLAEIEAELTKAEKKQFANLIAILKDKLKENDGDMSVGIGN
jgi:hypothetical protein